MRLRYSHSASGKTTSSVPADQISAGSASGPAGFSIASLSLGECHVVGNSNGGGE